MSCIYKVFAFISFLVRSYVMPNPFESLLGKMIELDGVEQFFVYLPLNALLEYVLYKITYAIVGLYYNRSEKTSLKGSILYLFFYWIHVGLISVIVKFNFSALSISLVVVFYVFLHILISVITSKIRKLLYDFSY